MEIPIFSSTIGLTDTLLALASIAFGAMLIASEKGTQLHGMLGFSFFACMLCVNVTALFTQVLCSFGPFHIMAIASLILVSCGVAAPVFFRHLPGWLRAHYVFMLWSYVGLIAAMFSELMVRLPIVGEVIGGGGFFWFLVIASSVITFAVGAYLINISRKRYAKLGL